MTTKNAVVAALLAPLALWSAPAKVDPVAEGYPDWQGISAKGYIMGREICPSDLRHKVTVVVEIEPGEKLQSQLILVGGFVAQTGLSRMEFGANWETLELPRDVIVVVSNCGGGKDKDHEAIKEALKYKGESQSDSQALSAVRSMGCAMYDDVTFTGAPDSTGKRPFVYVMGPEGREPLCQGTLNATMARTANAVITKGKRQIAGWETKWRPFYGNVNEPKSHPQLAKTLEKGKSAKTCPLDPVAKALLADVKNKDAEKAKEAQILYDALNQTRSDLVMRIIMEAGACPHRAYYDVQELLKYWPSEKKRLEPVFARFKSIPGAEKLAKIFIKLKAWDDPEFTVKNAGEAKKIVVELNKMKKDLEKLKDPEKNPVVIQNGASLLDMKVDELIEAVPAKVPSK
ncbi:MAG: hypothetical protein KBT68_11015 [bacterium]|nr:hypothetical protein [Candidatus Colisoma equi]